MFNRLLEQVEEGASERPGLDRVFKALASPARRRILDVLRDGPRTTGELADMFGELTRFTVMQHLKVLGGARLVLTRKSGRERHHYLNTVPIQELYERWVRGFEGLWAGGLVELRGRVEGEDSPQRHGGTEGGRREDGQMAEGQMADEEDSPQRHGGTEGGAMVRWPDDRGPDGR